MFPVRQAPPSPANAERLVEDARIARSKHLSALGRGSDQDPDLSDQGEQMFRDLLEALPAPVYTTDASGRLTFFNQAAVDFWGLRPDLGTSFWCGSFRLFWPDGAFMPHDQCPMARALKENRPVRGMEAIAERPDGTRVSFVPFPTPLRDASGKLVGAVNMLVDITARKCAEEDRALLVRELHHRVRNTLAMIQGMMGVTARLASSIEEFQDAFVGRIAAVSKTHTALLENKSLTVSLADILDNELGSWRREGRVRLTGSAIELAPDLAVPIGMTVHELTRNAVKHGALSIAGGTIEIAWDVGSPEAQEKSALRFEWIERGGPPPAGSRRGFGWRMLHLVLPAQTAAKVEQDHGASGFRLQALIPLPSPASRSGDLSPSGA